MKAFQIGNLSFSSKKDAKDYFKKILYKYKYEERINKKDSIDLIHLLELHPRSKEKIGCGISHFTVRLIMNNNVFFLIRVDGTETDFSYLNCINPPSRLTTIKKAARNTVKDDIIDYKNKHFSSSSFRCPYTNERVVDPRLVHVDHVNPSFDQIITEFLNENKIDINLIELDGREDGEIQVSFSSPLKEQFIKYHKDRAVLQLVSAKANLSILEKEKDNKEKFEWKKEFKGKRIGT